MSGDAPVRRFRDVFWDIIAEVRERPDSGESVSGGERVGENRVAVVIED